MYQKVLLSLDFFRMSSLAVFHGPERESDWSSVSQRVRGRVSVESRVSLTIIFRFRFPAVYFVTSVYNI